MLREFRLTFFLPVAAASVLALSAQQARQQPPTSTSRSQALLNPYLAPISGAPVKATFVIQSNRPLPDGSTEMLGSAIQVARDSSGRVSHELRQFAPGELAAAPPLLGTVLYDPRSHISQTINPVDRTDVELQVHLPANIGWVSFAPQAEDLGSKIIHGLQVRGVRRTWKNPSQLSAAGQPAQTVEEIWYSDRLQMIVSERRTDPLGGVVSITLSDLDRRNPPASIFNVPQGYQRITQKSLVHSYIARSDSWSIAPPSFDPNDGNGGFHYPSSIR